MALLRQLAIPALVLALAAPAWAQQGDETIKNPSPNTAEETIVQALKAGLAGDFDAYLATVHPEHKETPEQRRQRENYEWKRFSKQVRWYLVSEDPVTFVITRRQPQGDFLRVFVKDQKNRDRMPVPLNLKKDGSGWKIVTNSL